MWRTDTVYLQTKTEVNTYGSIKITWVQGTAILCDVQPMSKEKALKDYGLTDSNNWLAVYAPTGSAFVEGMQVKFDSKQWLVRLVQNWGKLDKSNHTFAILSAVV